MKEFVGRPTPFPQIHHERIKGIIETARRELSDAGFKLNPSDFPFILNHERMKSAFRNNGLRLTYHEIYALLSQWAEERGDPDDYAWQVLSGAVSKMKLPEDQIPERLKSGISSVGEGRTFRDFVIGKAKFSDGMGNSAS